MKIELLRPTVTPVNDHVWLLNDRDMATCYVVAGSERAMVIDTMMGFVDVRREAEALTGLPLICVNTHGHGDHIGGNWAFGKAWLHPADFSEAEWFLDLPEVREAIQANGLTFPPFRPIEDRQVFDLGGLELEAWHLPGHTPGGVVLLDRADRILFTGDAIIEQLWMQLDESLPLPVLIDSLERIHPLRGAYDTILHGHARGPEVADLYDELLAAAIDLNAGNTQDDEDYTWHSGTCRAHPYGKPPRRIVYNAP